MTQPFAQYQVLIVDDEPSWLKSVSLLLERFLGIDNIKVCDDSRKVVSLLEEEPVSLVLLDVTMPHLTGIELLPKIKESHPQVPVLMLSGRNEIDIAVQCIKHGAYDYFVKTVDEERLVGGVRRALEMYALYLENRSLKQSFFAETLRQPEAFSEILTQNHEMQKLFRYLEAIAISKEPVLISGESGVGKELVAKALHQLSAPDEPWVAVNVAGLDDQVFADTLFGHVRGAFTDAREKRPGMIEQARNGVLFLDEIGDLSHESQVKLLRLLQENEYLPLGSDVPTKAETRFVFASNHNLSERAKEGRFRPDLLYRLQTHQVHIPPLRKRREDIPLLLDHYLEAAAGELGKKKPTVPEQLVPLLKTYHFPGNVRELRSMVYDAVTRHEVGVLSMASFQGAMDAGLANDPVAMNSADKLEFPGVLPTLKEAANLLVDEALRRTGGNQTQAARLLGVTRAALSKRLKTRSETEA